MTLSLSLAPCSSIVGALGVAGPELLGEGGDRGETELYDEHSLHKLARRRHEVVNCVLLRVLDERILLAHFPTSLTVNSRRSLAPSGDLCVAASLFIRGVS